MELLKKKLRRLPWTKFRDLERLRHAIRSEIDSLTTLEQQIIS